MTPLLHYAPDDASLIVRLALEELGLAYEAQLVRRDARAQDRAAYRAVNPAGLIPALETPGGPIFETAAILLWLAEETGKLAPAPGTPGRGDFLKWLFFVSNTLHAQLRMTFCPEKYAGPDRAAQAALRAKVQGWNNAGHGAMSLPRALALLDARQAGRGLAGRGPAVDLLDLYLAPLLRWCTLYPRGETAWFTLADYPALAAMAARLERREAIRRAATAEGVGRHPFSAPQLAVPPEGSAT